MDGAAFPVARRLTTSLSKEKMGVGSQQHQAGAEYGAPRGPSAVPLGNNRMVAMILNSGPKAMASDGIIGAVRSGQAGCLDSLWHLMQKGVTGLCK